ncbi:MAG: FAD-dependent oxidoreductase, partial [bacterium]|nr:FAD-dependent oxidoreductase [bacterium]
DTVVLDKFVPGGQINLTDRIENYPAIAQISGFEMTDSMVKQVKSFDAEIKNNSEVENIVRQDDGLLQVHTDEDTYIAKAVILAPGSSYRKLGVDGEEKFRQAGTGVSYCGTCDAPFFRDKHVVSVGGGNVAVEEAMHLAKFCKKVTLVHRRQEFRATPVLVEELLEETKKGIIEIRYDSVVTTINGGDKVESATLQNVKTKDSETLDCDGVFIFVGMDPNTKFLNGIVDLDESGFIKCDPRHLRTNIPGIFTAGDCRVGAPMQLVTAIADGVSTAIYLKEYLRDPSWWNHNMS